MLNLFRAEWVKITGNRWVVGCLIWIFPLAAVAFIIFAAFVFTLSTTARHQFAAETIQWTDQMIGVWAIPNNPLGRLLLIGFTAVMFAGEYQWSTWKNTIPRNQRVALILVKFVTLGILVVVAFTLMSIIMLVGIGFFVLITGGTYGPPITGSEVLTDFAGDYLFQAALAFTSTMIAAGYSALAAMLTRSILGGALVGIGVALIENLLFVGLMLIAYFLDLPQVLQLYRFTPAYNLININEWIINNHASIAEFPYRTGEKVVYSNSLPASLSILFWWLVILIGLTIFLFRRQDITS
jgi:ABC-type transport system involved in multi-copper enzyme maturation permease subunit